MSQQNGETFDGLNRSNCMAYGYDGQLLMNGKDLFNFFRHTNTPIFVFEIFSHLILVFSFSTQNGDLSGEEQL